jgi:hypothetical protein
MFVHRPLATGNACGTKLVLITICMTLYWQIKVSPQAFEDDDQSCWNVTISRRAASDDSDLRKELCNQLTKRLQEKPSFRALVREKLRQDPKSVVKEKEYAAVALLKALGPESSEDCLYMLSDSHLQGLANLAIKKHKMEELACCLPAFLLSSDRFQRLSGLLGIKQLLREKGLPYYAILLNDKDRGIASEAAEAFALCRKEDAVPHLVAYLKENAKSRRHKAVVGAVLKSLNKLHGEDATAPFDIAASAEAWIKRLTKAPPANGLRK